MIGSGGFFKLDFKNLAAAVWRGLLAFLLALSVGFVILLMLTRCNPVQAAEAANYDRYFKLYTKQIFNNEIDWHLIKAQAIAESGLNRYAISKKGAAGIMQLMPATSAELASRHQMPDLPFNPRANIRLGVLYNFELWQRYEQLSRFERTKMMLAAYNAGPTNIYKARSRTSNCNNWDGVAQMLPLVTGKYAQETIQYVDRVLWIYFHIEDHDGTN